MTDIYKSEAGRQQIEQMYRRALGWPEPARAARQHVGVGRVPRSGPAWRGDYLGNDRDWRVFELHGSQPRTTRPIASLVNSCDRTVYPLSPLVIIT